MIIKAGTLILLRFSSATAIVRATKDFDENELHKLRSKKKNISFVEHILMSGYVEEVSYVELDMVLPKLDQEYDYRKEI